MKKINPLSKYFLSLYSVFRTNIRDYGMYIALAVIFTIFTILTGGIFLRPMNFTNLLNQTAYVSVLAVAMTLVIVTRQIDLSVGYLGAYLGAFVVVGVENTYPGIIGDFLNKLFGITNTWLINAVSIIVVLIFALIITILVGIVKGYLVAKVKVPSFVVTLAAMFLFKGLLMLKTNNRTIPTANKFFDRIGVGYISSFKIAGLDGLTFILGIFLILLVIFLGFIKRNKNRELGIKVEALSFYLTKTIFLIGIIAFLTYTLASFRGISYLLLITVVVVAIYYYITTQTVLGRRIYAVGGNPEAAELSGISVEKIIIIVFVSMGVLSLISGVMYASMLQNTSPNHGPFWELYAIAAAYIGGTSANGGVGKVVNAVVGSIVIMSLKNGMALAGVNANIEPIVLGTVLLLAVLFDIYTRNVRAVDLVGMHYAKRENREEFSEAKRRYIEAKYELDMARKNNDPRIIELEYAFTSAQGSYNRIKDKIRSAKEEDFPNVV